MFSAGETCGGDVNGVVFNYFINRIYLLGQSRTIYVLQVNIPFEFHVLENIFLQSRKIFDFANNSNKMLLL